MILKFIIHYYYFCILKFIIHYYYFCIERCDNVSKTAKMKFPSVLKLKFCVQRHLSPQEKVPLFEIFFPPLSPSSLLCSECLLLSAYYHTQSNHQSISYYSSTSYYSLHSSHFITSFVLLQF